MDRVVCKAEKGGWTPWGLCYTILVVGFFVLVFPLFIIFSGNLMMSQTFDPHATRREFLNLTAASMGAIAAASAAWPLLNTMNPAADTLALASIEVDLTGIAPGQSKTEMWRGKPVFIRRRTPEEINAAQEVDVTTLRDPESDDKRVDPAHKEWLILVGVCTHLGCVPGGQKVTDAHGDFGGWFCPCHGSHYDTSGRIRKGPAPKNLVVPPYKFLSDTKVRIG